MRNSDAVLAAGAIDAMCEQMVAGADQDGDVLVLCGTTLIVWATIPESREVPGLWTIPHTAAGKMPDRRRRATRAACSSTGWIALSGKADPAAVDSAAGAGVVAVRAR